MVRFDEDLSLTGGGGVDAQGPLDENEEMVELCAWVFQDQGGDQAAATEMTTTGGKLEILPAQSQQSRKWKLPLAKVGNFDLRSGPAFAVAVALMTDPQDKQKVVWWGHPVRLT